MNEIETKEFWKNLPAIVEGFTNLVKQNLNMLDESLVQMAEARQTHCLVCPLRTNNKCDSQKTGEVIGDFIYHNELRKKGEIVNGCSCNLAAKVVSPDSQCPLGKW